MGVRITSFLMVVLTLGDWIGLTSSITVASKGNNSRRRPSILPPDPVTPESRTESGNIKPHSTASTTSSRLKLVTTGRATGPTSPTKSAQSFAATQRRPPRGIETSGSTTSGHVSPSKSSITNVSPGTVINLRYQKGSYSTRPERSPVRSNARGQSTGISRPEPVPNKAKEEMPLDNERGRPLIRAEDKENSNRRNPSDANCRKIRDRIEELYRAKSMERGSGVQRPLSPQQDAANVRTSFGHTNGQQKSNRGRENERRPSKVADMRRKFEGSFLQAPVPESASSLPMPVFSNSSPFTKEEPVVIAIPIPPPAPPPLFVPPAKPKRESTVSPMTPQVPKPIGTKAIRAIPQPEAPKPPTCSIRQHPNKRSKAVDDKIKLFESIQDVKKPVQEQRKISYIRKIRTSLKSFFELKSCDDCEVRKESRLDSKDIRDVVDECEKQPATWNKDTQAEKWNTISQVQPPSGTDGTVSENGIELSTPTVSEMIVKEAQCGLREPKPVRITEMKRMMLLCRERVGRIDRERGRMVHSRKL